MGIERDIVRYAALAFAVIALSASAQDGMRMGDVRLSQDELTDYLSGQVLAFCNDGWLPIAPMAGMTIAIPPRANGCRVPIR